MQWPSPGPVNKSLQTDMSLENTNANLSLKSFYKAQLGTPLLRGSQPCRGKGVCVSQ